MTNQQILNVLEYGENVDQELLLGDIADISGCRNPAVFMERYFQIDDAHLEKEFQKFPSFSILDDCYPWDWVKYMMRLYFYFTREIWISWNFLR